MIHCFISVGKEDLDAALGYYDNDALQSVKNHKVCLIHDKYILGNVELFRNIEVFIQEIDRKGNMLDYYGRTIIPVETVKVIRKRIRSNFLLSIRARLNPRLHAFIKLLDYSICNNHYIVHHGI